MASPEPTQVGVASSSGFVAVISLYFPFATIFFFIFIILRPRLPIFYAPRLESQNSNNVYIPRPNSSLLGWILPTLDYPDSSLYKSNGVDVLVYIRFMRMVGYDLIHIIKYNVIWINHIN